MASFLQELFSNNTAVWLVGFSSLSESGFIPTCWIYSCPVSKRPVCSHLFQRVASFLLIVNNIESQLSRLGFSSLSESGFIPTRSIAVQAARNPEGFSSLSESGFIPTGIKLLLAAGLFSSSSHLFQRVASFLLYQISIQSRYSDLCSHLFQRVASFLLGCSSQMIQKSSYGFSSLSESGFIPTVVSLGRLGLFFSEVLISFREWLHSYEV